MTGTFLVAGLALGIQAVLAIFTYGKLNNEVTNHRAWLRALDEKQGEHGTRIARVEGKLGMSS